MEAKVFWLLSGLGETWGQKTARNIDLVKAAAPRQRLLHVRKICAFE
jgi:hypothetical protein